MERPRATAEGGDSVMEGPSGKDRVVRYRRDSKGRLHARHECAHSGEVITDWRTAPGEASLDRRLSEERDRV